MERFIGLILPFSNPSEYYEDISIFSNSYINFSELSKFSLNLSYIFGGLIPKA